MSEDQRFDGRLDPKLFFDFVRRSGNHGSALGITYR